MNNVLSSFLYPKTATTIGTFANKHLSTSKKVHCMCAPLSLTSRVQSVTQANAIHEFGFNLIGKSYAQGLTLSNPYLNSKTVNPPGRGGSRSLVAQPLKNLKCSCKAADSLGAEKSFQFELDGGGGLVQNTLEMTHTHTDAMGNSYVQAGDGAIEHTHDDNLHMHIGESASGPNASVSSACDAKTLLARVKNDLKSPLSLGVPDNISWSEYIIGSTAGFPAVPHWGGNPHAPTNWFLGDAYNGTPSATSCGNPDDHGSHLCVANFIVKSPWAFNVDACYTKPSSYLHTHEGGTESHTHDVTPDCSDNAGNDGMYIMDPSNVKTNYCCTTLESGQCVDSSAVCHNSTVHNAGGDGPDSCLSGNRFPDCSGHPTPPPSTHPMYFGTWYSRWCQACNAKLPCGSPQPSGTCGTAAGQACCSGLPSSTVNTQKMILMEDILAFIKTMTINPLISRSQEINSAASLGIGGNPSYQAFAGDASENAIMANKDFNNPDKWDISGPALWEANMCGMTENFYKQDGLKICNIGGWGAPGSLDPACSPWCSLGCNILMKNCPGAPAEPTPSCTPDASSCQQCANQQVPAALWRKQDIPNNKQLLVIATRLKKLGYDGISFDIEGMTQDFIDNLNNKGGFLSQLGQLRDLNWLDNNGFPTNNRKPWQIWIIVPGFNNINGPTTDDGKNGGVMSNQLKIVDHNNIDIVQLMIYGQGLDSNYAGDPGLCNNKDQYGDKCDVSLCSQTTNNQTDTCINQVINGTISALNDTAKGLSNIPANKKMIALSMRDWDLNNFLPKFMKDVWPHAHAGLFNWCVGEPENWSYTCPYGTCLACNNCGGRDVGSSFGIKAYNCPPAGLNII